MVLGTHLGPDVARQKCGGTAFVAERRPAKPRKAFRRTTMAVTKNFPLYKKV